MTDDARAVTGRMRDSTGETPDHPGDATGNDIPGNTEASTADMDAWTTSTERGEGPVTGADGEGTDTP